MDALGGYGSDSSSEMEQIGAKPDLQSNSMVDLLGEAGSDGSDSDDAKTIDLTLKPPAKRQKLETSTLIAEAAPIPILPAAPITSTSGSSLVHWDLDYVAQLSTTHEVRNETRTSELAAKLEKLTTTIGCNNTWADHLRTQQEFHNPCFFQSVVSHFGIQRPLGSQAKFANATPLQDYEASLFHVVSSQDKKDIMSEASK